MSREDALRSPGCIRDPGLPTPANCSPVFTSQLRNLCVPISVAIMGILESASPIEDSRAKCKRFVPSGCETFRFLRWHLLCTNTSSFACGDWIEFLDRGTRCCH